MRTVYCTKCGVPSTLAANFRESKTACGTCGEIILVPATSADLELVSDETADLRSSTPPRLGESFLSPGPVVSPPPVVGIQTLAVDVAPQFDPLLDTVMGKCHLQKHLGEGGMGTVYLAHHLTLDVPVAVKVLPDTLAKRDRAFVERFLREARTAAQIHHPNIVQVLDVDCHRGLYFILMEFVDGETAGMRLRRKRQLSEREVVEIGLGVAAALEYARRKSIVHRDIKPENILISLDGEIKLADLGLAKRVSGEMGSDLTLRDQALGTPYYISPEQATNARTADHRSDLYSLGATLFHLATGRPPFVGTSSFHTMTMHLNTPAPELRAYRAELSMELAELIRALLAKNRDERPQSAGQVHRQLRTHYERLAPGEGTDLGLSGTSLWEHAATLPGTPPLGASLASVATPQRMTPPPSPYIAPGAIPKFVTPKIGPLSVPVGNAAPTDHVVVPYPVERPSRFWVLLLLLPMLNWTAYLWVGTIAKKTEWLISGLGMLIMNILLFYFWGEPLARVGFLALYVGTVFHGLGLRREAEFRVMELARASSEELQRRIGQKMNGASGGNA